MKADAKQAARLESFLESRRTLWAVSVLTIALFAVTNLPWQLDDYDQAKQATVSMEMIKEGHWLYQHTSDNRVATKPPLVGWISAALFTVTRSWDVAWRLPSLACAVLIAIQLFRSAMAAYGSIPALMALSAFGLNLLSPRLATLVRSDMPLALVVFLIGLQIWDKIRKREAWNTRDRVLIFALLSAGMLIKGPIVYAFLLPGIAMFQWRTRKEEIGGAWCGWWPWVVSLAIFLSWVISGVVFVACFYQEVIVREFIARFGETIHRFVLSVIGGLISVPPCNEEAGELLTGFGQKVHQTRPPYFYLPHLFYRFAPWSLLVIAIAIGSYRAGKLRFRETMRRISPETFWLIVWILGGLLVMSIIPSKRVDRIFPVVPPLCLLLAAQLSGSLRDERLRLRVLQWSAVALIFAALFSAGNSAFRIASGYRDHRHALSIFGKTVRKQAEANHWRIEAIGESDEGLPLYLGRPRFLRLERAIAEWNAGRLDALAVPANEVPALLRVLRDVAAPSLQSGERRNLRRPNYVLLTR